MAEDFTSRMATPGASGDPTKHVNYTYGMVLGVDDLTQEFAYHSGRDHWMMRDAIGYGTVNGLRVTVGPNANGETEVNVTSGTALTPRGQLVHVPVAQCANLGKWLAIAKNKKAVTDEVGLPPNTPVTLSVVLCYRACPTDKVPVPGEPCRSEEDTMAFSRLRDDFKLELRVRQAAKPPSPDQREEDALRDFIKWLNEHLVVTEEQNNLTSEADFTAAVLAAAHPVVPPPGDLPPDFMLDNSPANPMRVHVSDACTFRRIAFRLWVTEFRPRWRPRQFNTQTLTCSPDGADEGTVTDDNCILLADLRVPITVNALLDNTTPVQVLDGRRPYLISGRMLQEWLLCGTFDAVVRPQVQTLPLVTIVRDTGGTPLFRFWFHLDTPKNQIALTTFDAAHLQAFEETDVAGDYVNQLNVVNIKAVASTRNVFEVELDADARLIRFIFDLKGMEVTPEGGAAVPLSGYARARHLSFIGQDSPDSATAFAPPTI
ncbi:MAG TPA: hypothetical protein VGW12_13950 [Pyrinomonadaceae bacterium]|nr:hypothetical protein [Pyrinomonadaceae bacterium]